MSVIAVKTEALRRLKQDRPGWLAWVLPELTVQHSELQTVLHGHGKTRFLKVRSTANLFFDNRAIFKPMSFWKKRGGRQRAKIGRIEYTVFWRFFMPIMRVWGTSIPLWGLVWLR